MTFGCLLLIDCLLEGDKRRIGSTGNIEHRGEMGRGALAALLRHADGPRVCVEVLEDSGDEVGLGDRAYDPHSLGVLAVLDQYPGAR